MEGGFERDRDFLANKQDFAYFLSPENGDNFYVNKIEEMINAGSRRLVIDLNDIAEYDVNLRDNVLAAPMEYLPCWEEALNDYVKHHFSDLVAKQQQKTGTTEAVLEYKIGLKGSFGRNKVNPQKLMSQWIGKMVCCEAIVTKCSLVRPKVRETVHYCEATQQFTKQKHGESAKGGASVFPTTDNDGNLLTTEFGLCTFSDHQKLYIQDMPEKSEPGSIPQTIECVIDDSDLIDYVKPGDRIRLIGVYRTQAATRRVISSSVSCRFSTVLLVNHMVKIGAGGIGKSGMKGDELSLSASEIKQIKKISKRKDVFSLIAASVIPSIYGHEFIKKAIVLLLFGGVAKNLENGTHLRGDINVLMIGDPSCGKSQLLRGLMNIGKLVINTTGRGSSGVGLTAAITQDKDSGDKKLEAGAMVLADGGIVCIDEFDKMTDVDRTAIHEVMEQQTVTIAKAGIHTSLNARCSVIAAANPVYGMYNRFKTPFENIGLPDSLLSRFDLLFIVLDEIDTQVDRNISNHVLNMHLSKDIVVDDYDDIYDVHDEEANADMADDDEEASHAVWSKETAIVRKKKHKLLNINFIKKYVEFAKKQYKPVLTDDACSEIANQYANLRQSHSSQQQSGNQHTLPITARCLETIIRLSTAHAKIRLSKKIQVSDVDVAMQLLNFALSNNANIQEHTHRRRGGAGDGGDDEGDEDGDGNGDVDMQGEREEEDQKMMELEQSQSGKKKQKRKRKRGSTENAGSPRHDKSKRARSQPDDATQEEATQSAVDRVQMTTVTNVMANYFRSTRSGQMNKDELLRQINEQQNDPHFMDAATLERILKHLHDKNKIFFIDPVVHQL
eukprot:CAMPEP_0202725718 /NCGR_PEP_ID=MMETSP1385-20130828/184245_1 /ASSEMBLY_ACC=CAM_ASM_000861 /TAXON_ID=933848 /ORGANISM="Elphidium margaritaceum" /LENGTH=838 /DNA_ID=CAMNT_0049391923 /DNA_START=81 /DNA_END=2597 /DNA_ORIENTATION=+